MTQPIALPVPPHPMSLETFLAWDMGNGDRLYELIEAEPVPMNDPTL
ncbi:MAG: hypothetical protein AB4042_13720 [Leptolyngbyaceae cyanobacterium]